jgi:hypothetical protein
MALLVAINLIHLPDKLAGVKSNSRLYWNAVNYTVSFL